MKSYTAEEIVEIRNRMHKELEDDYNENKKAWEKEDPSFSYNTSFFKQHKIESEDIERRDIFDCVESLQGTINEIKEFEENNFFLENRVTDEFDAVCYDDYLEKATYTRIYLIPRTNNIKEILQSKANSVFRDYISKLMFRVENHKYKKSVDCKLFELFINGNIDWGTLVDLTYSNCKI